MSITSTTITSEQKEKAIKYGQYIVNKNQTLRGCAKEFGVSKSTVFKYVKAILPLVDKDLALAVSHVIRFNLEQRHIRGGLATKIKFMKIKMIRYSESK
ncbi:sporulation transcriptional regulator SpoIIID [Bacillus phage vB_BceM-HSE3]|nr:sporulation transcriptional regulator SpoIIID [Bacillus phage vB_BceM-HSE3]